MSLVKWVDLHSVFDHRGQLVAAEVGAQVPFAIRRVYYLCGLQTNEPRGFHAHRSLEQMAVCVSGACTFVLDDGRQRVSLRLNDPACAIRIRTMIWHEMSDFSADCVLLVLASAPYAEEDYIRSYDDFIRLVAESDRLK